MSNLNFSDPADWCAGLDAALTARFGGSHGFKTTFHPERERNHWYTTGYRAQTMLLTDGVQEVMTAWYAEHPAPDLSVVPDIDVTPPVGYTLVTVPANVYGALLDSAEAVCKRNVDSGVFMGAAGDDEELQDAMTDLWDALTAARAAQPDQP